MSLPKTLPCHLETLMETLNIQWPLTREKVFWRTPDVFYGRMSRPPHLPTQMGAVFPWEMWNIRNSGFFLLFPILSHPFSPLSPAVCPMQRDTRLTTPAHSSVHYQSHRRASSDELLTHRSTRRDSARLMSKREKVKIQNRDREGALSSLFPWGWIISCRCCW